MCVRLAKTHVVVALRKNDADRCGAIDKKKTHNTRINIPSHGKGLTADLNVLKFYFVIFRLNRFHYSHRSATIYFQTEMPTLPHAKSEIILSSRRTEMPS